MLTLELFSSLVDYFGYIQNFKLKKYLRGNIFIFIVQERKGNAHFERKNLRLPKISQIRLQGFQMARVLQSNIICPAFGLPPFPPNLPPYKSKFAPIQISTSPCPDTKKSNVG